MGTPIHEIQSMLCDFSEDTYVSTVWHAGFSDGTDLLAILWRLREDKGWQLRHRIRYDSGTKDPFDGQDKKTLYRAVIEETEEEAIKSFHTIWTQLISNAPFQCLADERIEIKEWGRTALKVFTRQPWCHVEINYEDKG